MLNTVTIYIVVLVERCECYG